MNKQADAEPLKRKLSEVLSEGLLDSVLPYLIQHTTVTAKKVTNKNTGKIVDGYHKYIIENILL